MTEPLVERITISGSPEPIWAIIDDPAALGRALPGLESLVHEAADRFRAVIVLKSPFGPIHTDVAAQIQEAEPPRHLRLDLNGRARGLPGSFRVGIPIDLVPADGGLTTVSYSVELAMTGGLAALGSGPIRQALGKAIGELVRNVEREIAPTDAQPSSSGSGANDS